MEFLDPKEAEKFKKQKWKQFWWTPCSNRPPSVTRNIPEAVNRRLTALSFNQEIFNKIAPIYQEALKKSGYTYKLKYKQNSEPQKGKTDPGKTGLNAGLIPHFQYQ